MILQSPRPLVTTCEECGDDFRPQFEMTERGLYQLPAYCPCGFMTPGALTLDEGESRQGDMAGSVAAA